MDSIKITIKSSKGTTEQRDSQMRESDKEFITPSFAKYQIYNKQQSSTAG
jgi:hypothetical protein